ncbi:MAG: GntR family transcriptional regulator [Acidobacteria bacterium]|nr:GntR family transcriptional regulator [Acidobacteriota bacterium]
MIEIDPTSPVPLYLQIADQMRRLIAMGALKPGDKAPTVRELAVTTRVNRNTAARAIQHLEAEGVVRTRVGQGTFVENRSPKIDRDRRDRTIDEVIDRLLVEAHTLGLPLEELGWRLSRRIEEFRRRRRAGDTSRGKGEGE